MLVGMRIALVEAHYGRGKERLSGFVMIHRYFSVVGRRIVGPVGRWVRFRVRNYGRGRPFDGFYVMILGWRVLGWALVGSTGAVRNQSHGAAVRVPGGRFLAERRGESRSGGGWPGGFSGRRPSSR